MSAATELLMSAPRITVIIVSWNALPVVRKCLPSVVKTRWPNIELVFADNASTDDTADWVQAQYPNIRLIRHPENWMFSRGNNEAIRQTHGDYVVLLNNDVEVAPNWLEPMVAVAESDEHIAAVQPKILQYEQRGMFEYAGAAGGFLDRLGYPFARGRIFDHLEPDHGQYDTSTDLDWASGAALMLRRSAIERAGLLDEQFEMHMEEIDLCWRLRRLGYRITIAPQSQVYHMGGASLNVKNSRKLYYNVRNNLVMLRKNLPRHTFRSVYRQRMFIDHTIAKTWRSSGKWAKGAAVDSAYWDAPRLFETYHSPTGVAALPSYRRSILADFIWRRKRVFSALNPAYFRCEVH